MNGSYFPSLSSCLWKEYDYIYIYTWYLEESMVVFSRKSQANYFA